MTRSRYSINGEFPQEIPDRWRFSDGTVRTDLQELTDEELAELGWFGPIQEPPFPGTSYYTHDFKWNSETMSFDATEVSWDDRKVRVNYKMFWYELLNTSAYAKIKSVASQSLLANTLITEFIALLTEAKIGEHNDYANVEKIQELLFEIIENIPFTSEELAEIQTTFTKSGMFAVYTLEPPTE